jgi:uncharacterized membrane protein YgcG
MMASRLGGFLLGVLIVLGSFSVAWAEVAVPPLQTRVTDLTGTLSSAQTSALEAELQRIEQTLGPQLAVLLVASTQPESIEQYSMRVVERWQLGKKGKDDGLLLLVAKNDRKLRIEVGYGLEGQIPDALAKRVIDETITPLFKAGDFAGGITAGVQRLAGLIGGQAGAVSGEAPESLPPRVDSLLDPLMLDNVRDLSGRVSDELTWQLSRELNNFYTSGRMFPVFLLVVPSTANESVASYAERVLFAWGESDQLDVDRSLLMVLALDSRQAALATGESVRLKLPPAAEDDLIVREILPRLQQEDLPGALRASVTGMQQLVDMVIANKTLGESISEFFYENTVVLLIVLVVFGSILRWLLGPLLSGLSMGALVGAGVWWFSGLLETAIICAVAAFVFFLVGFAKWLEILGSGSGGSGGSSGGGFSGGGGSFGGGGASGGW